MSLRVLGISLAANFIVAGIVGLLQGPNAFLISLAIGLLLLAVAWLWPKKPKPIAPPEAAQQPQAAPININLSHIGNPVNTQDNRQEIISIPQPPIPPKPEANIKFLGVRTIKAEWVAHMTEHLGSFHERTDGSLDCVIACFRNQAVYDKTVKPIRNARASLNLFNSNGVEIGTGLSRSFWLGQRHDIIDLIPGEEGRCVILAIRDHNTISIPSKTRQTKGGYDIVSDHFLDLPEPPHSINLGLFASDDQLLLPPLSLELDSAGEGLTYRVKD